MVYWRGLFCKIKMVARTDSDNLIRIAIDRGGTFTDVWAKIPKQSEINFKLLSVDPQNYPDAPAEGIRRVLNDYYGRDVPFGTPIPKDDIASISMGTTVATNALLERKGSPHALVVTKGFKDVLEIGDQGRPKLFEVNIRKPDLLYAETVEIDERITLETFDADSKGIITPKESKDVFQSTVTGDWVRILKRLDEKEVTKQLVAVKEKGITNIAICLVHSYLYPDHELKIAEIAKSLGFTNISVSSQVGANMIKMTPRCSSASADAYLRPVVDEYIDSFKAGFEGSSLDGVRCEFMQSDGGLVPYTDFSGLKGILSGPAGGVVGYSETCYDGSMPVIGFDMGGTSTDVSRYGGKFEYVFETTTAGVTIQSPQLDINTVAAGGGSICFWENKLFRVGPESASAHPGPACYRKGGPLTVTDCNLYLGRIVPEYFAPIFGPNADQPLDIGASAKLLQEMSIQVSKDSGKEISPKDVALGFLAVANESMCRPIRTLTEAKGFETSRHHLACFGGAGGQHACEIADSLGINRVIIHKYSSILSAFGMSVADVVQEVQVPSSDVYTVKTLNETLLPKLEELKAQALQNLIETSGADEPHVIYEPYLNMRYKGTDTSLMILQPEDGDFLRAFKDEHQREFTFTFTDGRDILVDNIRVRAIWRPSTGVSIADEIATGLSVPATQVSKEAASLFKPVTFETGTFEQTPIYDLATLKPNTYIVGPAVILDQNQTLVIIPDAKATVLKNHVIIDIEDARHTRTADTEKVDPVKLSVFGNRFMSIAEQMGRTLQKIATSIQIKERYDFSCAIFGPDAELVANAPHVPVHLGSMAYAVRYQMDMHAGELREGDVLVSNHPRAGGTHLPDITVIAPVFDGDEIVFFVASRGHHGDIGGLGGNSFPPDSVELWQEGAAIKSFFLVRDGIFNEKGIVEILNKPGEYPDCAPSRHIKDNLSDLKAQIAANAKGISLIKALINEYNKDIVHFYMRAIRDNAETGVRNYLKSCVKRLGKNVLYSSDTMDNTSRIQLKITIDSTDGTAEFDFEGTSKELYGNMNAPPAVTYSAIIYCMRLLVGKDIPLNQGCLNPITTVIPEGSLLNPSEFPAVVGGNCHTSQRLCDVILKPFKVVAASQGDMNVVSFRGDGNRTDGYGYIYSETICGGAGAGPGFDGASAVQIHMTNTKCTDVELLERKMPVILRQFSIDRTTGGHGQWNGGGGVIKDWEGTQPLVFSYITERRTTAPYGMEGAEDGTRGLNLVVKKGRMINVGFRGDVALDIGDHFIIHTPGGGGWGNPELREVNGDTGNLESKFSLASRANGSVSKAADAQAASN